MSFDNLHIIDYVLMGSLGFFFLAQLYFYARYMCAPARRLRRKPKAKSQEPTAPGVSVILAAHNERENLSNYLQALLTQDYPEYEVDVKLCAFTATEMKEAEQEYGAFKLEN